MCIVSTSIMCEASSSLNSSAKVAPPRSNFALTACENQSTHQENKEYIKKYKEHTKKNKEYIETPPSTKAVPPSEICFHSQELQKSAEKIPPFLANKYVPKKTSALMQPICVVKVTDMCRQGNRYATISILLFQFNLRGPPY